VIILSFFRQLAPGDRLSALALGSSSAAPSANLIDRIFRGEVVDFLHFKLWRGYSWPDFNLADSFIVVGVGFSSSSCSRARARIGPPEPDEPVR
jgi:signal peptidase II